MQGQVRNMAFDKINALSAPPGHSLTDEPGKWAWEQPPIYADPDDAVDYVTEAIDDNPQQREGILKMLLAGITVEELVNQVSFKGFMKGYYTPDVAELIKPAVGIFLYNMALEEGFEPKMFVEKEDEEEVDDVAFFNILKQRNPELYLKMNEEINRQQRMEADDFIESAYGPVEQPKEASVSFLTTEESK
jgi:hypothetical protein